MINLKSKKGFLIRDFVVVGLVFGLIITLYVFAVGGIATNYNQPELVSDNFNSHYNKLQGNMDALDKSFKEVKGGSGLNLIGTFNVAFNSVFTVIAMVWNGLTVYTDIGASMITDFTFLDANVFTMFFGGVVAILTVYLIFIWLSSISRGKI